MITPHPDISTKAKPWTFVWWEYLCPTYETLCKCCCKSCTLHASSPPSKPYRTIESNFWFWKDRGTHFHSNSSLNTFQHPRASHLSSHHRPHRTLQSREPFSSLRGRINHWPPTCKLSYSSVSPSTESPHMLPGMGFRFYFPFFRSLGKHWIWRFTSTSGLTNQKEQTNRTS